MDADIKPGFDFTPDFSEIRSKAHLVRQGRDLVLNASQGVKLDDPEQEGTRRKNIELVKTAFIDALSVIAAWPHEGSIDRAAALTYFEQTSGVRLRTVAAVAQFGPSTPAPGLAACQQRTVVGVLLEPTWALHAHADLRSWVFGQTFAPLGLIDAQTEQINKSKQFKIVPNAHGIPYGLMVHHATVRDATPEEVKAWLGAESPVEKTRTPLEKFEIVGAEKVLRDLQMSKAAAPFWDWTQASTIGPTAGLWA